MRRDNVALREQLIERRCGHRACFGDFIRGHDGIKHEHTSFEREQTLHDFPPDAPKADDADGEMFQRRHRGQRRGEAPLARADVERVRNHLPRDGEDECQRVIRDFINAVVRNVAHWDPTLACGCGVHIVVADAVAHDGLRFGHGVYHLGVHRSKLRNDCIGISHKFGEVSG